MPVVIPQPTPLYPRQHEALYDPKRFVVIEASTKAGKTLGALMWQYVQCVNMPGVHRWLEPTYRMAKDLAFRRAVAMLRKSDPRKRIWSENSSELTITFANRSRWQFLGAENVDGIYGEDACSVVMDEATRMSELAWHAVRSTLTATRGPCRIIGNVRGRRNWVHRLAVVAQAGDPETAYHRLTAYDAVDGGVLDREEVESARRLLPDTVFRELYLAEPSDDGGNPFGQSKIGLCTRSVMSTAEPVAFGIDLARAQDWTVVVGLDERGYLCRFERWQGRPWDHTIDLICKIVGTTPAMIDATGVGDAIAESVERRCPSVERFVFTSQSKQALMERLAMAIHSQEVGFPPGVLRDELLEFTYQVTQRTVRYSAPEGMHDDCVCALALAVMRRSVAPQATPFGFRVI